MFRASRSAPCGAHHVGRAIVLALDGRSTKYGDWTVEQIQEPQDRDSDRAREWVAITSVTGCEYVIRWGHALYMAEDYLDTWLDDAPFGDDEREHLVEIFDAATKRAEKRGITAVMSSTECRELK